MMVTKRPSVLLGWKTLHRDLNEHYADDFFQQHKKPSMMDKLNPKVDANGDGKAGFMK